MIVCWSYCRPLAAAASALAERTREAPDRRPPRPSSDAPTDSLFTRYRNFIPSRRRSRLLRRLTRILSPSFSAHPIRVHRVGVSSTFARSPMHLLKPACRFTRPSRARLELSSWLIPDLISLLSGSTNRRATRGKPERYVTRLREIEF